MTIDSDVALLKRLDVFAAIDPVRLEVLAFIASRASFAAGETVFSEGDPADCAFLVTEGAAVMLAHRPDGAPQAARLDKGDLIGETALLGEGRRRSTVRAASRLETLRIERDVFRRLMAEFPEIAGGVARSAAGRLGALGEDLDRLAVELGRFGGRLGGSNRT